MTLTTTLIKIIRAFRPLCGLMEEASDYQTAFALVSFKRALIPHIEFFNDTERKLIEKYARRDDKGEVILDNGQYTIDAGNRAEFIKRKTELDGVTAEIPDMKLKKAPASISAADLEALMEIIHFPEGGENSAENS